MIVTSVVRVLQLFFGVAVLGLSITAIEWQTVGNAPATTVFGAVCGAFGIFTALIGAATICIEAIPVIVMASVDALTSVLFLVGGIAFAVGLNGVHCNDNSYEDPATYYNKMISGGCAKFKGSQDVCGSDSSSQLNGRCTKIEADAAFLFLGFFASVPAAILCYIASKRGGGRRPS